MYSRLTAYVADSPASQRLLGGDEAMRIGRDEDCGLRLRHPSVSRVHAELRGEGGSWRLRDLGSKNGTHVDGSRVDEAVLSSDCWLRLGDVYCEFSVLRDVDADANHARLQARRARATALTTRLGHASAFGELLEGSLRAVIELAHCRRGFLLLHDGGDYVVRAQHSLDAGELAGSAFSGSVGVVDRVLSGGRAVVVNDVGSEAWLATRDSVVAGGLRALACLPLHDGLRVAGAIYADRDTPGEAITTLDMELLQAFAERAAVYIAARRASDSLGRAAGSAQPARWRPIAAAHAGP